MPVVNRAEAADIFGVAKTTVDQWLRDGCPCLGGGGRGIERKLDTAALHRWLINRELTAPDPHSPTTPEGEVSLPEALRRKEVANALLAEHALAADMARVAPVGTMKRIIAEELGAATARIREIPGRLARATRLHIASPAKRERLVAACSGLIDEALKEIKS